VARWLRKLGRGALGRLKPATSSTALVPVTDRVVAISPPS
jgi:hypothetical protein